MTQVAICVIFGTAAVFTFVMQGRQWPTFILTLIFGVYLGGTVVGEWIHTAVTWLMDQLNTWLS